MTIRFPGLHSPSLPNTVFHPDDPPSGASPSKLEILRPAYDVGWIILQEPDSKQPAIVARIDPSIYGKQGGMDYQALDTKLKKVETFEDTEKYRNRGISQYHLDKAHTVLAYELNQILSHQGFLVIDLNDTVPVFVNSILCCSFIKLSREFEGGLKALAKKIHIFSSDQSVISSISDKKFGFNLYQSEEEAVRAITSTSKQ